MQTCSDSYSCDSTVLFEKFYGPIIDDNDNEWTRYFTNFGHWYDLKIQPITLVEKQNDYNAVMLIYQNQLKAKKQRTEKKLQTFWDDNAKLVN